MKLHHNTKNTKKAQRSNLHPTRHTTATHLRVATKAWLAVVCLTGVLIVRFPAQLSAATIQVSVGRNVPVFEPANVSIQPGDTVKWTWGTPGHPHTVTSGVDKPNGLFDSGLQQTPFTFSYTFNSPGTFDYYCATHLDVGMVGQVIVGGGSAPTPTPTATPTPPTGASQPLNISTRMKVLTGDKVMIGGFIITGNAPKKVIIRALGPTLAQFGIAEVLADPVLELRAADGSLIRSDDNWKDTQQTEIQTAGFAPQSELESALIATLNPGRYTAIVSGKNQGTGVGIVELYDLDEAADAKLANISTRGFVLTGTNVMIGGFILGHGSGPANVAIRGIGPSLTPLGIADALADPSLELHDSNGALLRSNDNWKDTQQTEIQNAGLAPSNPAESVILATLAPGAYSAVLTGNGSTTGVGLVELYRLP